MFEIETGMFVGGVTIALENELVRALECTRASGYLLVSDKRDAAGYRIRYFCMQGADAVDLDGIQFIEKLKRTIT